MLSVYVNSIFLFSLKYSLLYYMCNRTHYRKLECGKKQKGKMAPESITHLNPCKVFHGNTYISICVLVIIFNWFLDRHTGQLFCGFSSRSFTESLLLGCSRVYSSQPGIVYALYMPFEISLQ